MRIERTQSDWYLDAGVALVWVLLPEAREVLVLTRASDQRFALGAALPPQPELPGLQPRVDELFTQISAL